ncbi:MAG: LuxR C-terminal-related transcriptional regulator [Proteobacteria bacterium]|jgi:DNA-binding CsgD family transcriptional regulator|nr:LuxR C-terminal-related transcriptional regulator [Pseudomonadota bacterium]
MMTTKERNYIIAILALVAVMVSFDLAIDSKEGVILWHVLIEASAGLAALAGIFFLLKGSFQLRHQLSDSQSENQKLKAEAQEWKSEAQRFIEGLSKSIDLQLTKWNLTPAEKEVSLLLLKGLSLKEIADVRGTTEKTARVQSISVYSKSGLTGRSELAAFFLEDLLQPQQYQGASSHFQEPKD